jgi:hypothetical protein
MTHWRDVRDEGGVCDRTADWEAHGCITKVCWRCDPTERVAELPEGVCEALDIACSVIKEKETHLGVGRSAKHKFAFVRKTSAENFETNEKLGRR